ncbi:MAG: hypothetical protein K2Q32_00790 [Alphaproteobacteria bacterium]|nr:hypothetical protein [Alphaproteobacteria bacterium]
MAELKTTKEGSREEAAVWAKLQAKGYQIKDKDGLITGADKLPNEAKAALDDQAHLGFIKGLKGIDPKMAARLDRLSEQAQIDPKKSDEYIAALKQSPFGKDPKNAEAIKLEEARVKLRQEEMLKEQAKAVVTDKKVEQKEAATVAIVDADNSGLGALKIAAIPAQPEAATTGEKAAPKAETPKEAAPADTATKDAAKATATTADAAKTKPVAEPAKKPAPAAKTP